MQTWLVANAKGIEQGVCSAANAASFVEPVKENQAKVAYVVSRTI
jgi:hypothetical protein